MRVIYPDARRVGAPATRSDAAGAFVYGYGSAVLSPPVRVFQVPLPHFGQGGRCCVEPTCKS